MGTLTVACTKVPNGLLALRNKRIRTGTITMSTSYATGGDTIPTADAKFGLAALEFVVFFPKNGYTFQPDNEAVPTKVLAYVSGGTQVTAAVNLSSGAGTVRFLAIGR